MTHRGDPRVQLTALRATLVQWLIDDVYPRWAQQGIDPQNGGFSETLDRSGRPLDQSRRARVHPRQLYAFSQAPRLGWRGDVPGIVARGIDYFTKYYRRTDGLFRTLVDVDGTPLDERALLYDQSFALLGFAAAAAALDARVEFERRAIELRHLIEERFRAVDGAFYPDEKHSPTLESNPHMHLLEACLTWTEIGSDTGWAAWARGLVQLALSRFIRQDSGALGESYTTAWLPTPGIAGRIIEPGHQFEWAWLLLRCEGLHPASVRPTALKLISIGDERGVRNGVAVNSLLDDLTVNDPNARLWPQTERLKAALLAATLTDAPHYWWIAHSAAMSFFPYLETPVAGLWFDVRRPNGTFIDSPTPASTLYHLVGAVVALDAALTA
jgi:mannose/cellobiose epimerase-like protein (N-acyl-D-glucosamine 2-epimerase family)